MPTGWRGSAPPHWISTLGIIAETCAAVGSSEQAEVLYRRLIPHRHLFGVGFGGIFFGSVERSLGQLAAVRQDWAVAFDHFERALTANERVGAVVWLAHTQQEFAAALLDGGDAADRVRAAPLAAAALATATDLGLELIRQRCEQLPL